MIKICKDCTKRYPACHDTCPYGYREEKERDSELKKARNEDTEYYTCVKILALERRDKWRKKK